MYVSFPHAMSMPSMMARVSGRTIRKTVPSPEVRRDHYTAPHGFDCPLDDVHAHSSARYLGNLRCG